MKLIDRYLISHFLIPFGYCIFAFLILYITYDLSVNLDEFLKNKVGIGLLCKLYLLKIPLILVNSTPLAILLSLLYSLGNMNRHHEIVAMRACGIHIDRILLPFLVIGFFLAGLVFFINDQFVCKYSFQESILQQEIFKGGNSNKSSRVWQMFPFRNPASNRDWFIESFDFKTQELKGVVVREFANDGATIEKKVMAESGKWIDGKWIFFNGTIYHYTREGLPVMTNDDKEGKPHKFSKLILPYEVTPQDIENSRRDISTMGFYSLLRYLMMQNKSSILYRKILVDLHYKIAFPFVCVIAVLVGIPFAIRTQRGGFIKGVGLSIIIFLAYYGLSIISMSMGKEGILPPFLSVWIPNALFLVFGGFLLKNAA